MHTSVQGSFIRRECAWTGMRVSVWWSEDLLGVDSFPPCCQPKSEQFLPPARLWWQEGKLKRTGEEEGPSCADLVLLS